MISELRLDVAFDSYRIDTKKRSGVRGTLFLLSGSPRSTWCLRWPRITRAHATLSDVERGRSVVATIDLMSVWRLSACILHTRRSYAGGLLAQPASSKCFRLISNTWFTNPTDYCDCRIYCRDGRSDVIANHAIEGSGPLSRHGIPDARIFWFGYTKIQDR